MVTRVQERPAGELRGPIIFSFILSLLLTGMKFAAYAITGSAAILSDAAESIVNVIAAAVAFASLKVAAAPPDEGHPYGHGKAEFLSAAFEGGAIIVAAAWIIYKAVHELVTGPDFHDLDAGLILVAVSMVANAFLGLYLVKKGRRFGSIVVEADGRHILTDAVTSAAIIAGLFVMKWTGFLFLDAVIAITASLYILRTGWKLLKRAGGGMMDEGSAEDETTIDGILASKIGAEVCGYHKIRQRHSGGMHFVDFHLSFPTGLSVERAHAIATEIETDVAKALGDAGVMAHIEPCKDSNCRCRETPLSV